MLPGMAGASGRLLAAAMAEGYARGGIFSAVHPPDPAASASAASAPAEDALPRQPQAGEPELSVVVPVRNEAGNILPLVAEIRAALAGRAYEIVYVDDGSTDASWAELEAAAADGRMRALRHRLSCGQSAAIATGVRAARGRWIGTLDGDGQNDPADLPSLLARAQAAEGAVMVVGHRVSRKDSGMKRFSSRFANGLRARLLGDATPDTGCGLKVFPRALFMELPRFDHMHRYLPALALRAGARVESVPVNHRPRTRGRSNYGTLDRALVGIFDLVGVYWLMRRGRRPELDKRIGQ
jgi:dolichol-phosphate mannosyltransferase